MTQSRASVRNYCELHLMREFASRYGNFKPDLPDTNVDIIDAKGDYTAIVGLVPATLGRIPTIVVT